MLTCNKLLQALEQGSYDRQLTQLYAPDGDPSALEAAKARVRSAIRQFDALFSPGARFPVALFSSPGRTELGGNHTDHQHGQVLCASVNLDILACASPNGTNLIRVCSEGYPALHVMLDDLEAQPEEINTSAALVRGVAASIAALDLPVNGFDLYMTSQVLSGSGLSSSAAYEILIGTVINHFFCGGTLSPLALAKIGQFAENNYFGKPSGLMDQCGCAMGGAVFLDFADAAQPAVTKLNFDFSATGYTLCLIDTGSCHADLTESYAEITREMGAVALLFGKKVLREVPEEDFMQSIPALRDAVGDRAVLRALHFYAENRRALEEAQALESGDFPAFLELVRQSGRSSTMNLQNTWSISTPEQQAIPLTLALGEECLRGAGAIRVHGGGFAGTVQAFVPTEQLECFCGQMEAFLGAGACHILRVRHQGSRAVIFE